VGDRDGEGLRWRPASERPHVDPVPGAPPCSEPVFFGADDNPVGAQFVGLTLVYVCDFFASQGRFLCERLLGLATSSPERG